jgi:hypothetical protein
VVRIVVPLDDHRVQTSIHTSSNKLAIGMLAVLEVGRLWVASDGSVRPGATVLLVDTRDGGQIMSLRYNGYEPNTIDGALDTLRRNGFSNLAEISGDDKGGSTWLAGTHEKH